MDIRNILSKLDQLTEGTMSSAKSKPTGPKFTGKMKGTDPASAAKDKYVGGMEESIFKELEATLQNRPNRDLMKEFKEFSKHEIAEAKAAATASFRAGYKKRAELSAMTPDERRAYDQEQQQKQRKRDDARLERERQKNTAKRGTAEGAPVTATPGSVEPGGAVDNFKQQMANNTEVKYQKDLAGVAEDFTDLERAVMEGGHELVKENPVTTAAPAQPGKPTLGADLTKPQGQQDAQQQQQDQKAQQLAAQKELQQQATLTKGVNALKSAGAAVSNPAQVVQAFDKADTNQGLTPADKNSIASAGTVLAPIMANPQLQGKFKDLVNQASTAQKKQQQQQQAQQAQQPAQGQQPQQAPAPVGQVK